MDLKAQGSWTRKANFIGGPRTRAVKFSIANQIYYGTGNVVGGNAESSDFYKYDISTDSWTQVASLLYWNQRLCRNGLVVRKCFRRFL